MSSLNVSAPHRLTQEEALRRIQRALGQAKAENAGKATVQETWNGYAGTFSVSVMNQQVSGTVAVNPSDVTVQADLPLIASVFAPMIESTIRNLLTKLLA